MEQSGSDDVQARANRRSRLRIFVSYRHKDNSDAAQLVVERLRNDGFKTENIFIDSGQASGESWVEQIEQALTDCDVLIAVVGKRWLRSADAAGGELENPRDWTRYEIEVALERAIPIMPVFVSRAQMPPPEKVAPSLAPFVKIQGISIATEGEGRERLLTWLDEIAQRIAATKISNLGPRNRLFVGREEFLTQIKDELNGPHDTTAAVAIVGLPAIGKTQLALEFAHRQQDSYQIIWEIPAEQPATYREKLGELSRKLKLRQRQNQDPVAAVRTALDRTEGWLLILDNVKDEKDIKDLIPQIGGHVIITSQHTTWDTIQAVNAPLDVMTEEEAIALLRKRLPKGSDADLGRLARALMYIPQALEQASAYIYKNQMSVANYIAKLPGHESELLNKIAPGDDYGRTLLRAWKLALEEIESTAGVKGPGAVEILNLCAFLAPENIPLGTFGNYAELLPELAATILANPIARTDAIGLLADLSQVRWTDDSSSGLDCVSLHRTVQYFVRVHLDPAARQTWSTAAVNIVLAAFPEYPSDVWQWKACNSLLPHAEAALQSAAALGIAPLQRARLLDRIGVFRKSEAQFAEAEAPLRRALAILDTKIREHRVTAATVRNHLGSLAAERGDFEGAHADHVAALAVHKQICGPESREVAEDRLNIGRILMESDDLAGAGFEYEEALRIRTNIFGPNHITVIECHEALFTLRLRAGNVLGARPHLKQLLNAREALGQQDHPDTMWYHFLDEIFFGENLEESPYSRFEEMISATAGVYTPRHPEIANWRTWLADDLLSKQQFDRAEANYRQALKIEEEAYERTHWKVASSLLRVFLTQAVKDQPEARQTLIRAITILRKVPTVNNVSEHLRWDPDSAFMLAKFDDALDRLGEVFAAVRPFQRICQIVADTFGEDSSLYACALEHFAAELREAGRPGYIERGLIYLDTALAIFVRRYGHDHRRTARCLRHLGSLQAANQDVEKAAASYEQALTILDAESQPNQIDLLTVLTEYYPLLDIREKQRAIQPSRAEPADGSSVNATPAPAQHTAQEILGRALALATNSVGVWPLFRRAQVLAESNQPELSLEIFEQVLEILKDANGDRSPVVANCLRQIGGVLMALDDPGAALSRYNEMLEIDRAFYGPEHGFVATDLRLRAFSFGALGDAAAAAENLERSLEMTERLDQKHEEELGLTAKMDRRFKQWIALGDAANGPDAALAIYRVGLNRADDVPGAGQLLRARIGGIAAIQDDLLSAVDYFRASMSKHVNVANSDPFWATVRGAAPSARDSTDRERLTAILSTLREDPSMQGQIRTFRPQISALIPQDWAAKESITLLAPDGHANVIASSEPLDPEVDTDKFASIQGDLLRDEFPEYQEFQFEEVELFNGLRGCIRHFEWKPPDGARVTQIQLYYVENGRGYTVTATTPTSNFSHAEIELRQVLGGLKLSR